MIFSGADCWGLLDYLKLKGMVDSKLFEKKETPLNQTATVVVELGWLPHHFFFVQIDAP